MRDVRRVEAWRKISFSFSLHAHWQICTKRRHFSFLFLGSIVLLSTIYIHIQRRIFCTLPLHNFLVFFFLRKERRTGKKRSYDDTHWFSLVACCYNDDLYLIIEIDCLRPFMRTFFSFPSLIYSY